MGSYVAPTDKTQQTRQAITRHAQFEKVKASGGAEGWAAAGDPSGFVKPQDWDTKSPEQKQAWLDYYQKAYDAQANDPSAINWQTGQTKDAAPLAPDLTDEQLQKTRTSTMLRLQLGKNRSSSMSTGKLGGLDLGKPVLGGY